MFTSRELFAITFSGVSSCLFIYMGLRSLGISNLSPDIGAAVLVGAISSSVGMVIGLTLMKTDIKLARRIRGETAH